MIIQKNKKEALQMFDKLYKHCFYASVYKDNKEVTTSMYDSLKIALELPFGITWIKKDNSYVLTLTTLNKKENYTIILVFEYNEKILSEAEKYGLPKLQTKFTKDEVVKYLEDYQIWRRDGEIPMPDPTTLGLVIDEAIRLLKL